MEYTLASGEVGDKVVEKKSGERFIIRQLYVNGFGDVLLECVSTKKTLVENLFTTRYLPVLK